MKAPYASGRDWNKVEKLLEKEADEKKEGEAALNEMFQKIYADANDEVTIFYQLYEVRPSPKKYFVLFLKKICCQILIFDAKNCVYLVLTHQLIRFFFQ